MRQFTAFLRAVNVGGRTIKMDVLRKLFEALGHSNVSTFIASGNVIFHSKSRDVAALEKAIERLLQRAVGYDVGTYIRSTSELEAIARYDPFPSIDWKTAGITLYVHFMREPASAPARKRILALKTDTDDLHVYQREIYWLRHGTMQDSPISSGLLEKALGAPVTARNINTVNRIVAKYAAAR
jgi:uncharacterized protein (DUF1697 family)